jgi:RNA polymerase sigma factor (sigma-70 family)
MEKQKADETITLYLEKIYGFAFKKAYSYDEAEELASEMTAEVYTSLLNSNDITNVSGYIWRICENVYSRYVAKNKKQEGLCENYMAAVSVARMDEGITEEEKYKIRREISFLSELRRDIVFSFYYKNETIKKIAARHGIPEGTVKWHLNKIKKDLKEGMTMERKIGELGLNPVKALDISHNGMPGSNGGPEYYLQDKIDLNIVYSAYKKPRTLNEIAEELGMTPVFVEDRVARLADNGFLVKKKGGKYVSYVEFTGRTYSLENMDRIRDVKLKIADQLLEKYVPVVRKSIANLKNVYIPGGNRELLEAAAIMYALRHKCTLKLGHSYDCSQYFIKTTDGGCYTVWVDLERECVDPDYKLRNQGDFCVCGSMWRESSKYPVRAWSIDSRLDSRTGNWQNNQNRDYEYVYELITGRLTDGLEDTDKINRLKEKRFIDDKGNPTIMIMKGKDTDFIDQIPELDEKSNEEFSKLALDFAMQRIKNVPSHMHDLVMADYEGFISDEVPMMVMDRLYADGTLKPLTESEQITANLIMFCDVLPTGYNA